MVTPLQELDPIALYQINASVLLGYAPRPDVGAKVFQRFRLADTLERISQYRLHKIKQPLCGAAIGVDPVAQIIEKLRMADRQS